MDEILKNKKFNKIHDAYIFVSGAPYGENTAFMDKQTGEIFFQSEYDDFSDLEGFSDIEFDKEIHLEIPHKNDLGLGRNLVFDFVGRFIPEEEERVSRFFRKRGAYSKYKGFLEAKGLLEQWYDFENKKELAVLLEWCEENEVVI